MKTLTKQEQLLKIRLDKEVELRNQNCELSYDKPDPLLVASRYKNNESAVLLCALFGYGKASLIVKFLDTLDFSLLDASEDKIEQVFSEYYYRFQNSQDIVAIFKSLRRLKQESSLNDIFLKGYDKEQNILEGIDTLVKAIHKIYPYESRGYQFLVSSPLKRDKLGKIKEIGNSPYKRWNMFLRWVVRKDSLDFGLWKGIHTRDLLLPLDTHTFQVSKKLGLLERKTYDLKSAILITEKLKKFDENDPIKYDFSLYRIGQEKIL